MRKQILLAGTLCLMYGSLSAQQLSPKLKDYPPSVVIKVYDVNRKIPLGDKDQLNLAQHFDNEEKAIAKAILLAHKNQDIDKIRGAYLQDFQTFLKKNNLQRNYYASRADSSIKRHRHNLLKKDGALWQKSTYTLVLAKKDTLTLTKAQQDALHNKAREYTNAKKAFLAANPKKDFHETVYAELKQILSDEQLKTYLRLKNSNKATALAEQTWKELEKYKLSGKYDVTVTKARVYQYLLERLVVKELLMGDIQKRNQVLNSLNRPKELNELNTMKRSRAKSENMVKNSFAW